MRETSEEAATTGPVPGPEHASGPASGPTSAVRRVAGQLRLIAGCAHPRQAVLLAVVLGALAYADRRSPREAATSALAVLLVQLVCGLMNDVCDRALDERAQVPGKPVADGRVPAGNAAYVAVVLFLVSIPASLQNGTAAAGALLVTYVIAFLHNRVLHRTPLSFVGWAATFALFPTFLSYGGWGAGVHGGPPTWWATGAAALLGFCVHFLTTLPDLVEDNRAGVRSLPLVIALRTGATRLLVASGLLTLAAVAAAVLVAVGPGLRQ